MNTKVKNTNTKKVVTKKTAKVLVKLTEAQKEERRKKRLANPQSSHLASNVRKAENLEFKFNAKANLIEAKRLQNKVNLTNSGYENLADLKTANKVINLICKKPEFIKISIEAVRVNKDGSYSVFYFSQLAQKIVSLLKKDFSINTALVHLANVRKAK
jgi:hypothetical protein